MKTIRELWQVDTYSVGRIERSPNDNKCIVVKGNQYVAHNVTYIQARKILGIDNADSCTQPISSRTARR